MARIYVSSTYTDLKEVREQVRLTLRRLGHEDVAMEYYVAEDQRPLGKCLADVDRCDVYVGLFAWRYGFIPPGHDKSITDLEYRRAWEQGKPCLAFLLEEQASWPMDRVERSALGRIEALRKELAEAHLGGYFTSKDDIGARVAEALHKWEQSVGRGSEKRLAVWLERYTLQLEGEFAKLLCQGEELRGEEAAKRYLEVLVRQRPTEKGVAPKPVPLSQLAGQPGMRVVVLGGGGAGKTTMLRKLAWDCARQALTHTGAPVPIYVRLNFFDTQTREFEGLLEIAARGVGLARDELYDLWQKGTPPCLFLLDGLNEVRDGFQDGCRLALQQLTQRTAHGYVITSRPGLQAEELVRQVDDCLVTEVLRLEPDQIKRFLALYGAADLYDRMEERLQALARTPFLLWAIAQSCMGLGRQQLPANIGQLYENLIDRYIFGVREQTKRRESRPTQYHYERVKKLVLACLAMDLYRRGIMRQTENDSLRVAIRDHLRKIRADNDGVVALEPHTLMPEPPVASAFLNEVVDNGVLVRIEGTLEFMHESVRDYFAAVEMSRWSLAVMLDAVPRLVWRHIEPQDDDLTLDGPPFSAAVMLAGLLADSSDLLRRLAGHHPLLAAHCFAGARSLRPEVETVLVKQWLALLDHRHPRYRWVGCQCVRVAKVDSAEVARRLGKLIRYDRELYVRGAAARALASLNDPEVISGLVEETLNGAPESAAGSDLGRAFVHLRSEVAVQRLFEIWRDPKQPAAREHRAEQLLAIIDPRLVREVLHEVAAQARSRGDDARVRSVHLALEALASWRKKIAWLNIRDNVQSIVKTLKGVSGVDNLRDANTRWDEATRAWRQQMENWSTEQLIAALKDGEETKRLAAVHCLGARRANAGVALLAALAREQSYRVQPVLLEALRALDQPEEVLWHWRERMLDTRWTLLFRVEPSLQEELKTGKLTERWRSEFERRHLSLDDQPYAVQTGEEWLIGGRWSRGQYENPIYVVKPGSDALEVLDARLRPRLAAAAVVFGTAAIPVLQAVLAEKDSLPESAVAKLLGEIGGADAVAMLAKFLLRDDNVNAVETAIQALGKTRRPSAILPLIQALQSLCLPPSDPAEPSTWQIQGLEWRCTQITTALRNLHSRGELVTFAREALAVSNDQARFIATACLCAWNETDSDIISLLTRAAVEENPHIRLQAVKGLAAAKTEDGEQALLRACLEDVDWEVRRAAGTSLRWFTGDRPVLHLIRALQDQDVERRVRAAEALAFMQDELAIPTLLEAFETGPSQLRIAAGRALSEIGYEELDTLVEGLISIARQDPDERIRELAFDVLQELPEGEDKLYRPMTEALSQGRFAQVIDLIGREAPFLPKDAYLYLFRGMARAELERPEEAMPDLDQAIALAPRDAIAHYTRAWVLEKLDRWQEALAGARQAVELERDKAEYQAFRGWCAYRTSDLQESIAASRRALELNPKLVNTAFNLGLALLAAGQWEEAVEAYRRGIENSKEVEDGPACEALESALVDLKNLATAYQERPAFAAQVQALLEQARAERLGPKA